MWNFLMKNKEKNQAHEELKCAGLLNFADIRVIDKFHMWMEGGQLYPGYLYTARL